MNIAIDMAERGILPDWLIRWGIRGLDKKRLRQEDRGDDDAQRRATEQQSRRTGPAVDRL